MKLELSIADDRELKSFIKDSIKAEIVSIARGEVKGILVDVVKEGYIPKDKDDIERIIREEIKKLVVAELNKGSYFGATQIKNIAREEINLYLRDLLKIGMIV